MALNWWENEYFGAHGVLIKCKDGKFHEPCEFKSKDEFIANMLYPKEYPTKEEHDKLLKSWEKHGGHYVL